VPLEVLDLLSLLSVDFVEPGLSIIDSTTSSLAALLSFFFLHGGVPFDFFGVKVLLVVLVEGEDTCVRDLRYEDREMECIPVSEESEPLL
jgi:hypothetical protein